MHARYYQVQELEKERTAMEEEKVQTYRYKQLLLKQRDIMIQLTARLNERDQSILHLQVRAWKEYTSPLYSFVHELRSARPKPLELRSN